MQKVTLYQVELCIVLVYLLLFLDILLYLLQCDNIDDNLVHRYFNEVKCWKELHILHSLFGIIASAMFIIINFIFTLILFESRATSNDPSARIHSRNEFYQYCFKTACILITTFFIGDSYRWFFVIFMIICGILLYVKLRSEKPYYREIFNKLHEVTYCILIWACFCLIIVMASEDTQFNGGMQAFIIIIPLIGIIVVTRESKRQTLLLKSIDDFESSEQWYLKIRYYIDMIQHKEVNRESAVQLNGFIFHHEEFCTIASCPLKNYMSNAITNLKDKKKKQQRIGSESYNLLMSYAKLLFTQGVAKFPSSSSFHISYAAFLKDRLDEKATAISELAIADKTNPQLDEQFLIYRYRRMIEETKEFNEEAEGGMDVASMLAYENYLQQLKEVIDQSAYLHMEFWMELLEAEPDLRKMDTTGVKINSTILIVQEKWEKVQKINPNVPKALKLYSDYLIDILNNNEEASDIISKLKGNKFIRNAYTALSIDSAALGMGEICATMGGADGTPCIVADGNPGKIGEIYQFNLSACRLFGYTKAEFAGKKINFLMPELYAKYHDTILQQSIDKNDSMGSGRIEKFVLGRHKSGYLLPLPLQTRLILLVNQGTFFVATFKYEKKGLNVTYLLLNENKDIIGVSSKGIQSLGLTNHILKNYRISALTLASKLGEKSMADQFASKNGGNLEFFRPDISSDADANNISGISKAWDFSNSIIDNSKKLRVKASKDFVRMNCIMTEITYNAHTLGSIVRLESIEDAQPNFVLKQAKPQQSLQFAFDPAGMRYIQQNCDEDAQYLISREMSQYVNILKDRDSSFESQSKINTSAISAIEKTKEDDLTILRKRLEVKKKAFIEGVTSYRWINGKREKILTAKSRLLEKENEEQKDVEELHINSAKDRLEKNDVFSALKSHKIFIDTLNDHTTPPSVQKVKYVGYAFVLILLALASTEFGLSINQFNEVEENINLIVNSYRQIVVQTEAIYYISKITLLSTCTPPKSLSVNIAEETDQRKKLI